jgi:hypothetical protein
MVGQSLATIFFLKAPSQFVFPGLFHMCAITLPSSSSFPKKHSVDEREQSAQQTLRRTSQSNGVAFCLPGLNHLFGI